MITIYRIAHWLHLRRAPLLPWLLKAANRILFGVVRINQPEHLPDYLAFRNKT
jgi:serine acetyltransferase